LISSLVGGLSISRAPFGMSLRLAVKRVRSTDLSGGACRGRVVVVQELYAIKHSIPHIALRV
jgi:hypothetical protein